MGCSSSSTTTPVCDNEVAMDDFFDKYSLGVKLGRGAFATVRACTKISSAGGLRVVTSGPEEEVKKKQQERAVKILHLRNKDKPTEVSQPLLKTAHSEAYCWKAIGIHPNCVRLFDMYFAQDFCYMVMEKCGTSLLQAIESMPELTERGLGNIAAQMLLGIAHCHECKVVHRDIKPDNFLVGADNASIKLADFGLSAMMPKQGKLPGVFGTAPFMCPEMLTGRWYDEKADVWSFAVIVYVMMYGAFPYVPTTQSAKAMKQAIIDGVPAPCYEPIQKATGANASPYRSPDAVDMVTQLLSRDSEVRPSAEDALQMPWMRAAMQGTHMSDAELPSLRPMLHAAKKCGAFEVRDPARDTVADIVLNKRVVERVGVELPSTPSSIARQQSGDSSIDAFGFTKAGSCVWENSSNRSTACESISTPRSSSSQGDSPQHRRPSDSSFSIDARSPSNSSHSPSSSSNFGTAY